jgi:pSer/pThr/pTyr-binding forkhead associated (FHA) protein
VSGSAIQIFVLRVDAFLGTELFGSETPVHIGRHRDCAIRLDDDTVSRHHCQIQLEGEQLFIEDLGSANGTLVNSCRILSRTAIVATDSVQIGDFTLKVRPLLPRQLRQARPSSGISETATRKKALLSADGFIDTDESLIDLGSEVDPRLYEAALRRATGGEPSKSPVPLVVMDGGRTASESDVEREHTARDERLMDQVREALEPPTNRGFELDPSIDERINELEQVVHTLKEDKHIEVSPPKTSDEPKEEFHAWVNLVQTSPIDELARAIGTAAAHRPSTTPWRARQKGAPAKAKTKVSRTNRSASVRARRAAAHENVPLALSVPREIPVTDLVRARAPRSQMKPVHVGRKASVLEVTPVALITDQSIETEQVVPARHRQQTRAALQQRVHVPTTEKPAPRQRRKLMARLVTPTGMQICVSPLSKGKVGANQTGASACSMIRDCDIVSRTASRPTPPPKKKRAGFRAIEITTRQRGRLVDIATLSQNGEQYILGYKTPQGAKAPSCGHRGLRLVRINPDRTVDLVFPRDAGGHLMRDGETVMFSELTQGRKYSSVRLSRDDQVSLMLNHKGKQVSYHVRFLQNPYFE